MSGKFALPGYFVVKKVFQEVKRKRVKVTDAFFCLCKQRYGFEIRGLTIFSEMYEKRWQFHII